MIEFDMIDEGPSHYCIGNQIFKNWNEGWIILYEAKYLFNVLHYYDMAIVNSIPTPKFGIKFSKTNCLKSIDD